MGLPSLATMLCAASEKLQINFRRSQCWAMSLCRWWSCPVKRNALFWLVATTIYAHHVTSAAPSPPPQTTSSVQRFVCHTGYTPQKCHADTLVLRKALAKYPVADLGEWTWILIRSEDWKSIVVPRGLGPDSPAFTYYEKRETFLEEALVAEVPERRRELLLAWRMSMEDLLDFAVAHELGHVLCNEKDEANVNRLSRMLQEHRPFACETQLASKGPFARIKKQR